MCVITVPPFPVTNCAVPENIHTPPQKGLEFLGGWGGSVRPKYSKKYMKLNWNYQRGGGGGGD